MDAEKVVAEYQALTAPEGAAAGRGEEAARGRASHGRGATNTAAISAGAPAARGGHGWMAVVIAVLVIAGVVYWGQSGKSATGTGAGRRTAAKIARAEHARRAAEHRARSAPGPRRAAGAAAGGRTASAAPAAPLAALPGAPAGPLQVAIAAAAPAWIHLSAAGKTVVEMTLAPGNTVSYALTPPVELITGNAGATAVTVNGAAQPALGAAGAVVRWRYPPGTVQALPGAKPAGTKPKAAPGGGPAPIVPAAVKSRQLGDARSAGGWPRGKGVRPPVGRPQGGRKT